MHGHLLRCFRWLACAALLVAAPADATDPAPDLVLHGPLQGSDNHSYREVPFDVPKGANRITIQFEYGGRAERTTVDLGLIGPGDFKAPDGFRGWTGGSKSLFTVSATDATPSFSPGAIRPGRWKLLLGFPNVRSTTRAEYTARIWFGRPGDPAWMPAVLNPPLRSEAGWYRGDLHMHGAHSDGSCVTQSGNGRAPCPLIFTVQEAARRGLDFIALSDHNTVSQFNDIRELQPYFDRLLLIPAREVTTFQGHANLIGTAEPLDFRISSKAVPDWNAVLRQAEGLQAVFSVNHPLAPNDETCMGCGWKPAGPVDWHRVQAVEAVNGMDAMLPNSGIPFWQNLLDQGYRLTGVGGSDNHDALRRLGHDLIGVPTTVVHADALSMQAIVAAIRAGHVFIDVQGSRDRLLELNAQVDGQQAQMGDQVSAPDGHVIHLAVASRAPAGSRIEVLLDGKPMSEGAASIKADSLQSHAFDWRSDGHRHWVRANVRGASGELLLVGNPIYVNTP